MTDRTEYQRKYREANKEKKAAYMKVWQQQNARYHRESSRESREKNTARVRAWRAKNPERAKEISRETYWRNPEKRRALRRTYPFKRDAEAKEQHRKWAAKKRLTDPIFKLVSNFRSRLNRALKGKSKSASTVKLLGCSVEDFTIHLESFFEPEMHWGNYGNKKGQWSVDHVMPFAIFDLSKPEHQKRVCHFSNLRPMWHVENMKKHAKPTTNQYNLL